MSVGRPTKTIFKSIKGVVGPKHLRTVWENIPLRKAEGPGGLLGHELEVGHPGMATPGPLADLPKLGLHLRVQLWTFWINALLQPKKKKKKGWIFLNCQFLGYSFDKSLLVTPFPSLGHLIQQKGTKLLLQRLPNINVQRKILFEPTIFPLLYWHRPICQWLMS